jgi:uncharacterized membrane protein
MIAAVLAPPAKRASPWPALALGIALGGFFDGIVLHQVLQWHHLLSAVATPGLADLRAQVMVDGVFHAAMYLLGAIAAWRLFRAEPRFAARPLAGWLLLGFATWHALDAVLSHWVLGLHRIRMDTGSPLAWDLGWLLVFGGVPALLGVRWVKGTGSPAAPATRGGAVLGWVAAAALAGGVAAAPPPAAADGTRTVAVVLGSAAQAGRMLGALPDDARVVAGDAAGTVWTVRWPADGPSPWRLLADGAVWVSGGGAAPGCAAWSAPGRTASPR